MKKKIALVIVIVLIISTLLLLKQKYQEYKYRKHYCELLLNGSDPYRGFPKGYAIRQYYHCIMSDQAYRENTNCYQQYRQEIIDCQQSSEKKMSEEEIRRHLTGGAMDEICQDTAKLCTESQKEFTGDEDLKKAMLILCIEKTRKACTDLGIEWK
ncbi:MAG: hypothetical protein WC460_00265 [Patescibacteria group bacterium]